MTWAEFQGNRPVSCLSYSYPPTPLQGAAIVDLSWQTARILAARAERRIAPAFISNLEEVMAGVRDLKTVSNDDHIRVVGQLFEDGIEASWESVWAMGMVEIHTRPIPNTPQEKSPNRPTSSPTCNWPRVRPTWPCAYADPMKPSGRSCRFLPSLAGRGGPESVLAFHQSDGNDQLECLKGDTVMNDPATRLGDGYVSLESYIVQKTARKPGYTIVQLDWNDRSVSA